MGMGVARAGLVQRRYGLAASVALHGLLITAALWSSRMPLPLPIPEPSPLNLLNLPLPKAGTLLEAREGAPPCTDGKSYWGIGMQFNLQGVVINAPASYPAFQAGMRLGDVVLDPDMQPDQQGYDTVEFSRSGRLHRLRIKAQWVCLR